MTPQRHSKKRVGDETFRPNQDNTSTSTVESRPARPERQPKPKRNMEDATYNPQAEPPSTSTVESSKRSPGRPRRNTKTAPLHPHLQPRITSEATELRLEHGIPLPRNPRTSAPPAPPDHSSDKADLSITDRLKNMRDFLTIEDSLTHPHFSAECDAMEIFLANLASVKEMFDVRVYNDVKAMLRVHRERMLDLERERNEVVTYKVPSSYSTTESAGERVVTYKVPSFSTTTGSGGEERERLFSPPESRGAETDGINVGHGMQAWDDYGDGDTAELWHDERKRRPGEGDIHSTISTTERNQDSAVVRGKRPAADHHPSHTAKRTRWAENESESESADYGISQTDRLFPISKHRDERSRHPFETDNNNNNREVRKRLREEEQDDLEPIRRSTIPRAPPGSLIPPEIANFHAEHPTSTTRRPTKTTRTTRKTAAAAAKPNPAQKPPRRKHATVTISSSSPSPNKTFHPGDPVFMFGETKYLQALQSRQIEKDLAADDEATQAKIDKRPLMGMWTRFRLPDVVMGGGGGGDGEEKKKKERVGERKGVKWNGLFSGHGM
ncbi:MAG: hypothetical protein L6R35_001811 [Caloplaca aegaea]|nr:MAG: hypothetical protein L6R35_001811 [Caloplaca aegaea]